MSLFKKYSETYEGGVVLTVTNMSNHIQIETEFIINPIAEESREHGMILRSENQN